MANGNGLGAQGAAIYGGMNGAIMPSAGHYSDMQALMQNMEQLSGWLEQNRQDWSAVQDGLARVERLQGRLASNGQLPLQNGVEPPAQQQPSVTQLQTALASANTRILALERTFHEQTALQQHFEDAHTETTERIRQYCFEQQKHVVALHQHYTQSLAQSRSETVEAQLTHQAWQAALQRLSEGVRVALKSSEEGKLPEKRRIAALKEENRVLRAMVGWEPPTPDSDDEEGGEVEERRGRTGGTGGLP